MSGEETDDDTTKKHKHVRDKRLMVKPVRWISPDIQQLFRTIDTYEHAVGHEGLSARGTRGPVPLPRFYAPPGMYRPDPPRRMITKLARNVYSDSWYRAQNEGEQLLMDAMPAMTIPSIVSLIDVNS